MLARLYIVATPIGNLEDITLRALRVLRKVDLILAEDTRVTKKILRHYGIETPILSYHQHSSERKKKVILSHLVKGQNLALVSDAGTPGISDPGNELVDYLLRQEPKTQIITVPGPSAITAALSVSGFNVSKFIFLGFLPKKKRKGLFNWLKEGGFSFAFYESPHRILKAIDTLAKEFGEKRRIFVARELTKLYESLYRGTIKEVREKLKETVLKGELVVVVEGE